MKAKLMMWMMMILIMTATAMAWDMCGETKEINQNCTMLTPYLPICPQFNYTIFNATNGESVESADLTAFAGDIYQFNVTQPAGDYIIKTCDGHTREIKVKSSEDNNMIVAAIVMIPAFLGLILLLGSFFLGDEHNVLRIFMFMLSPIMFIVSLNYGVVALVKFFDFPELQDAIGNTVYWFMLVLGVIVTYFLFYLFIKMVHYMAEKKEEKLNY